MPQPTSRTDTSQLQNQFSQSQAQQNVNTDTTGTQTRDPYAGVMPQINDILGNASSLYQMDAPIAPGIAPNAWYNAGIAQQASAANDFMSTPAGGVSYAEQPFFDTLFQAENPANYTNLDGYNSLKPWQTLQDMGQQTYNSPLAQNTSGALTDTQQQILNDNANRLALEQASMFSGAGRYGSEGMGMGIARGVAQTNAPLEAQYNQNNIQNALQAQGLGGQLYGAGAQGMASTISNAYDQQQRAFNSLPGLMQGALQPGQVLQQAGSSQMSFPWQNLQNYAGAVGSTAPFLGNAGTINTAGNLGTQQNSLQQTFGQNNTTGTSVAQQATPWTTFAGLGLAGAGLISDRRLKTDIERVGKDPWNDVNIYSYRFKGSPHHQIGPIAQDVERKIPSAVSNVGGVKMIHTGHPALATTPKPGDVPFHPHPASIGAFSARRSGPSMLGPSPPTPSWRSRGY